MYLAQQKTQGKVIARSHSRKKIGFFKKLCIFAAIITAAAYFLWTNEDFQRKFIYPYPYKDTVAFYAQRYGVDESLVAGVILTESKFKPEAVSHRGAVGLMQIMPETGEWIAQQIEDDSYAAGELKRAKFNIKYGTWYLASLREEFQGNDVLSLAAYNAGRGNVHEWMEKYGWDENFSDYKQIPFPETREYVKYVLENQKHYRNLYK